jgi:hypothetical protein
VELTCYLQDQISCLFIPATCAAGICPQQRESRPAQIRRIVTTPWSSLASISTSNPKPSWYWLLTPPEVFAEGLRRLIEEIGETSV